jgi:hypothetical protein
MEIQRKIIATISEVEEREKKKIIATLYLLKLDNK